MNQPLDPEEANQILRRAAELAMDRGRGRGLDRGALEAAAAEVGIGSHAVRRALAEHDAGLLRTESGRAGILGPSRIVVTRTIDRRPSAARDVVRAWLTAQVMERTDRRDGFETWRRRHDLIARVRRRVDPRRRVRLRNLDAVHLAVAEVDDGQSLVRLEADFDNMRRGLRTGVVVIPAGVTPALGVGLAFLTGEVALFAGSIPLAAGLGGLGVVAGRRTLANERDEAGRVLSLFLDELEGR